MSFICSMQIIIICLDSVSKLLLSTYYVLNIVLDILEEVGGSDTGPVLRLE